MLKFKRLVIFIVFAFMLLGTIQPVGAVTESEYLTRQETGALLAGAENVAPMMNPVSEGSGDQIVLRNWAEKCAAYQEQTQQGLEASRFNDTSGHWAEASIQLTKGIGLCNGFPDGSFRPDLSLSQLEAISLLMLLATDEMQSVQVSNEKVLALPAWGQAAVQKAASRGIINLDEFDASQPVNRATLVLWLGKSIGLQANLLSELPFEDSKLLSSELARYIMPLYQQGIITGYPDHKLHPEQVLSRAEMAVILGRLVGEQDVIHLNILSVNDFHGALLEGGGNPGAAKLASYLKDEKAQNPQGTLILSAGDMMQGTADSNLLNGEPVIEAMNEIGFDAMTIGNHEFDWGVEILQDRAEQASFPFLTCNVKNKKDGQGLAFAKPYIITEKAGVKIGIIGVTTQETATKVLQRIISPYDIVDPAPVVNRLASELREKGVQMIIVLGHLGACPSQDSGQLQGEAVTLAEKLKGVDVLITAHTHERYAQMINEVAVVQAGYNGRATAKVSVSYSLSEQKVLASYPAVIELTGLELSEVTPVKAIVDATNKKIGSIKNKVVGSNSRDLSHDRYQLSPLGQWFTDTICKAAKSDIFFINGGALRTGIPQGDITVGKLWEVLPFDNTLCTMTMTGTQISQVLQHGIHNEKYGMVQFAGLRVQYDGSLEPDKRIVEITLADGTPLQADKTYRVGVNDFMAEGGDGFTMFMECPDLVNTQEPIRTMLTDFIEKAQSINFRADDRLQEK